RMRERLAIGADHAELMPGLITASVVATDPARHPHLVAPMLAPAILTALHEKTGGRAQRIIGPPERTHTSVAIVIHADVEPDLRHPLRMPHGARPGAAHLLRRSPAALNNHERIEQLLLPIFLAARFTPGERRQSGKNRPHVVLLNIRIAIGGLDPPDPEHHGTVDAEILLDALPQRRIFFGLLLADGN